MANAFLYLSFLLACLCGSLIAVLFIEITVSVFLPSRKDELANDVNAQPVAVVIPAHDEGGGIVPTIEDIKAQLRKGDRLLVVADNCTDDTAARAAAAGAETIGRHDRTKLGKSYALDFALKHLSSNPPGFVSFIDADCRLAAGSIDQLRKVCAATNRPVQALDLMTAPEGSPINLRVAEFAWRVKNWARPLGLQKLNLPCQLMGTGMMFPWDAIRSVNLASGSIVEDLKLGLDLAQIGYAPFFCPKALVLSRFPTSEDGATDQRKRWETGHIQMIVSELPRSLFKSMTQRNLALFVLSLDLAVPPLSALVMLLAISLCLSTSLLAFGLSPVPLVINAFSLFALVFAMFVSWTEYGRDLLPVRSFFAIARYVLAKVPIYRHALFRSDAGWTRADREKDE
jgi:cellulose synthase/poly-beta-1,6-N-acetylglucosamine synthase-like glycosyltransferase